MINNRLLQNMEVSAYNWLKSETKAEIFRIPTRLCCRALSSRFEHNCSVFAPEVAVSFTKDAEKVLKTVRSGKVGC
jgi:hypothetical protein